MYVTYCQYNLLPNVTVFFIVQFRVWARPEARNSVRYALEKGADIIDFFEDYFQIPFPLPKMGKLEIFV